MADKRYMSVSGLRLASFLNVKYLKSERGQTLVEYGLLTMLVSIVIVAVFILFGEEISNLMNSVASDIDDAGIS